MSRDKTKRLLETHPKLRRRGHHEVVVRRGVDRVGAEVHLVRAAVPFGQSLLASLRTVASGPCLSWTSSGVASLVGTLVGTPALCGPARVWPSGHPSLIVCLFVCLFVCL